MQVVIIEIVIAAPQNAAAVRIDGPATAAALAVAVVGSLHGLGDVKLNFAAEAATADGSLCLRRQFLTGHCRDACAFGINIVAGQGAGDLIPGWGVGDENVAVRLAGCVMTAAGGH